MVGGESSGVLPGVPTSDSDEESCPAPRAFLAWVLAWNMGGSGANQLTRKTACTR